ncbi:MAG TPA: OsmC family protein [Arenicellales bacterium]|nr:OsmC family protein [Arenicellales bacterium]
MSMDSDGLRNLQAPLKELYRRDPDKALVTLHASGRIGDNLTCKVDTGRAIAEAGLHPATGGDGSALCSGDILLEALTACAGVTLNAVATAMGIELRDAEILAEGDLDFRGTLGVDRDAPVGFQDIRLRFRLDTDANAETLSRLMKLTERYCVVFQTLNKPPSLSVHRENTGT